MLFQPRCVEAMWDTWMCHHQGLWYLFYLITEKGLGEGVGLATSPDGVCWTDQGVVLTKAPQALWLGTGAVWPARHDTGTGSARFICNFSQWHGRNQAIYFAASDDLRTWRRLGDEHCFPIDTRWYQATSRGWSWLFAPRSMAAMYLAMATGVAKRWDSIHAVPKNRDGLAEPGRAGAGFWGFWTATPKGRPGFGFGESDDGLHWRSLPPPEIDWSPLQTPTDVELAAVEPIAGRWYALVGSIKNRGMLVLQADSPAGPYRLQPVNPNCLSSPSLKLSTYYARFFASPDGPLVHHQSIARKLTRKLRPVTLFAPLKRAHVDDAGTLRLAWWEGNNRLTGPAIANTPTDVASDTRRPVRLVAAVTPDQGIVLQAKLALSPQHSLRAPIGQLLLVGCKGRTLSLSIHPNWSVTMATANPAGVPRRTLQRIDRHLQRTDTGTVRLLLRRYMVECYLNDFLVNCFSLPECGPYSIWAAGRGGASWQEIQAFDMVGLGDA